MTTSGTCFHLLGPFELVHDGQKVEIGGSVGMAILATLAYPPDKKVPPTRLAAAVWGTPDAVTADNMYRHLSRLRNVLKPIGLGIVGHRPGYRLPVTGEQVDAVQFDELVRTARSLVEVDPDQAVARLTAALALWRGTGALDNLPQPGMRRIAAALDARRLDAEEDLAELELHRGNPEVVLDRLYTLSAAHPQRPRLKAALARALHATGRTDEAENELGVGELTDDGAEHLALAEARHVISRRDGRPRRAAGLHAAVPFQLPADTVHFTGREEQFAQLLESRLTSTNGHSRTPGVAVVSAVEGMAGVGKTALAVHAAHHVADQFDDGVLFVDLHGFTPGAEPVTPDHALDHLLRGLGLPGNQIPPDLDARAALYRSILARRRVMIVLDNAADEAQLQPLLPSAPGCWVLITSRRHLAGLDDALHLSLPVLPTDEAAALLRALIADRATTADAPILEEIVSRCGHLPLAIRIAAARLRSSRASTPARLLAELADALGTRNELDWLSDGHRAVTATLDMSYRHLAHDLRRAFGYLGLHPGTTIEPYALAALADTSLDRAQRLLDQLHAASLINQADYRRYTLHDLVATYANTVARQDQELDQPAALDRLLSHYADTTSSAMALAYSWDATYPWEADHRPPALPATTPTPSLADDREALHWLDTELDNLLAAAQHAASHGRPDHTSHQATVMHRYLHIRGRHADSGDLHALALEHSRRTGNRLHEHNALQGISCIHLWQGRYEQAADCGLQSLTLARALGNRTGEQLALHGLADGHLMQNRFAEAADCFERALAIAGGIKNLIAEQDVQHCLGMLHRSLGQYEKATQCYQRGLAINREMGHHSGQQAALQGLASIQLLQGRPEQAITTYQQALTMARQTRDPIRQQSSLRGLGDVLRDLAEYQSAADHYQQALTIAGQTGDLDCQFEAHQGLGRTHHGNGRYDDAREHHNTALALATDLGQPADQARAHDGLAHTYHVLGHTTPSRHHWHTALQILTNLNLDHTDEPTVATTTIQAHLTALDRCETTAPRQ